MRVNCFLTGTLLGSGSWTWRFKLILFVLGSNKLLLKSRLCDVHYKQITITWKLLLD